MERGHTSSTSQTPRPPQLPGSRSATNWVASKQPHAARTVAREADDEQLSATTWQSRTASAARASRHYLGSAGATLLVALRYLLRALERGAIYAEHKPRTVALGAAVLAPALLGLIFALQSLSALYAHPAGIPAGSEAAQLVAATIALGGLTALYAAGLGLMWLRSTEVVRKQQHDLARLDRTLHRQADDLREAREHNELLTAMREVSRVVASCDDVDEVLTDVLRILEDFAHPEAAAIFVNDPQAPGKPLLHAASQPGFTPGRELERDVRSVAASRQLVRRLDRIGRRHTLLVPFDADQDTTGVLWVTRRLEPIVLDRFQGAEAATNDQQRIIERFDRQIVYFIKHVALAVRHLTLYDRATVDGLTRLFNRQHYTRQLQLSLAMTERQGTPLSIIMIDIDHFKSVNDTHGHLSGDMILQGVAELMRTTIRESDMAFRYGGEEMAILCPGTTAEEAAITAERLRVAVAEADLRGENDVQIPVTISLGVAAYVTGEGQESFLSRADQALYASKEGGRNRYTLATQPKQARSA